MQENFNSLIQNNINTYENPIFEDVKNNSEILYIDQQQNSLKNTIFKDLNGENK